MSVGQMADASKVTMDQDASKVMIAKAKIQGT